MASNRDLLVAVCKQLEPILDQLVLVGGCSVELLVTDRAAVVPRTTQDVDMVVKVVSRADYYVLEDKLRELGFQQAMNEDVVCRWRDGWRVLDLMPDTDDILGFSNPWYPYVMASASTTLLSDLHIRHNNSVAFIACKLAAFAGRGNNDFRSSHDFEDIVTLLDGRASVTVECGDAEKAAQQFISQQFTQFLANPLFAEYVAGHLAPDEISQQRLPLVLERFKAIAALNKDKV